LARIARENTTTLVSSKRRQTVSLEVHRINLLSWRYGFCRPAPGGW
jgi:hypothetical protein